MVVPARDGGVHAPGEISGHEVGWGGGGGGGCRGGVNDEVFVCIDAVHTPEESGDQRVGHGGFIMGGPARNVGVPAQGEIGGCEVGRGGIFRGGNNNVNARENDPRGGRGGVA